MVTPGILYIVATPIGNRADLSERARHVLAEVDLIAAEDTRHSGQFLAQLGIKKPLFALHDHNEAARASVLLEKLQSGLSVALVSDAGTPLISDPGYRLVAAVGEAGLSVVPVPGPCAAIAALSIAGLATDRFIFEGFLPARSAARQAKLAALVMVEAPATEATSAAVPVIVVTALAFTFTEDLVSRDVSTLAATDPVSLTVMV